MSAFAFLGFRRGGSSVAFSLLQHLLQESGLVVEDIVAPYHDRGIPPEDIPLDALIEAFDRCDLVGCFRRPEALKRIAHKGIKPILLVRDPRDCQLSWYDARHLHLDGLLPATPIADAAVSDTLSEDDTFDDDIAGLVAFTKTHHGLILRYEDMVFEPLEFLSRLLDFTGFNVTRHAVDSTMVLANFVHTITDRRTHDKSGVPFSAARNLSDAEFDKLTERFSAVIVELGYPIRSQDVPSFDLGPLRERDSTKRYLLNLSRENGYRIAETMDVRNRQAALEREMESVRAEQASQLVTAEHMQSSLTALVRGLSVIGGVNARAAEDLSVLQATIQGLENNVRNLSEHIAKLERKIIRLTNN